MQRHKDKDKDKDKDDNKDNNDKAQKRKRGRKKTFPLPPKHRSSQSDILLQVKANKHKTERKKQRKDTVKINIADDSQIKSTIKPKSPRKQSKPSGHGPPARPLSKVKSNSDVHSGKIKRKRIPTLPYKKNEIVVNKDNNDNNDDGKKRKKT